MRTTEVPQMTGKLLHSLREDLGLTLRGSFTITELQRIIEIAREGRAEVASKLRTPH